METTWPKIGQRIWDPLKKFNEKKKDAICKICRNPSICSILAKGTAISPSKSHV